MDSTLEACGAAETRVRNATEALVAVGYSQALAVKTEEQRLAPLRASLAAGPGPARSKVAIHPRTIDKMLQELAACMETDPAQARTVLPFMPSIFFVKLEADGRLRISGGFDVDALVDPEVPGSSSRRDRD